MLMPDAHPPQQRPTHPPGRGAADPLQPKQQEYQQKPKPRPRKRRPCRRGQRPTPRRPCRRRQNRRRYIKPSKQYTNPSSGSEPPYSPVPEANPLELPNQSTLEVRSGSEPSLRFGPSGSSEIQEFPNQLPIGSASPPEIQENLLPVGLNPPAGVEYESDEDYVAYVG